MSDAKPKFDGPTSVSRSKLVALLNEDLAREYQAIISYVVYSQVLKGPQYMNIAAELEKHAGQELQHGRSRAGGLPNRPFGCRQFTHSQRCHAVVP
jgi:hypothetical protein